MIYCVQLHAKCAATGYDNTAVQCKTFSAVKFRTTNSTNELPVNSSLICKLISAILCYWVCLSYDCIVLLSASNSER